MRLSERIFLWLSAVAVLIVAILAGNEIRPLITYDQHLNPITGEPYATIAVITGLCGVIVSLYVLLCMALRTDRDLVHFHYIAYVSAVAIVFAGIVFWNPVSWLVMGICLVPFAFLTKDMIAGLYFAA